MSILSVISSRISQKLNMLSLKQILLLCSFVGNCWSLSPIFINALTNCSWGANLGAPQRHSVRRPVKSLNLKIKTSFNKCHGNRISVKENFLQIKKQMQVAHEGFENQL